MFVKYVLGNEDVWVVILGVLGVWFLRVVFSSFVECIKFFCFGFKEKDIFC